MRATNAISPFNNSLLTSIDCCAVALTGDSHAECKDDMAQISISSILQIAVGKSLNHLYVVSGVNTSFKWLENIEICVSKLYLCLHCHVSRTYALVSHQGKATSNMIDFTL